MRYNIISNNCLGGFILRQLNLPFTNPFIWCVTPYHSIKHIMQHYDTIDWFKINLCESSIKQNTFVLTIDNAIHLHFVHHYWITKSSNDPSKNCEVSPYIYETIVSNYFRRVKRMLLSKQDPVFIISPEFYAPNKITYTDLKQTKTKYNTLFFDSYMIPNNIYVKYNNEISNFINQ